MSDTLGKRLLDILATAINAIPEVVVYRGGDSIGREVNNYVRLAFVKEKVEYPTQASRSPIADRYMRLTTSVCVSGGLDTCEAFRQLLIQAISACDYQGILTEKPVEDETNWSYPDGVDRQYTCAHIDWQFRMQTKRTDLTRQN